MASEIFESLFWIGLDFVPKSHLVESFSNDRHEEEEECHVNRKSQYQIRHYPRRHEIFVRLKK